MNRYSSLDFSSVKSTLFKATKHITFLYKDYFKVISEIGDSKLELDLTNPDKPGIKVPASLMN